MKNGPWRAGGAVLPDHGQVLMMAHVGRHSHVLEFLGAEKQGVSATLALSPQNMG